jgi:predicted regulator of Ras-like GTPase activity (Roadblock/LC7/MglB family)
VEAVVIDAILNNLISSVNGAQAAIFLDGDGESISQVGNLKTDMKLLGAWKEIHLDRIKEISGRLGLGTVRAVLFSLEEGNELAVPVSGEYCLLLFLSAYASLQDAMAEITKAVELLKQDIT